MWLYAIGLKDFCIEIPGLNLMHMSTITLTKKPSVHNEKTKQNKTNLFKEWWRGNDYPDDTE